MKPIKEFREVAPGVVRCDVRRDDGASSFRDIINLFNTAAADFPALTPDDVKVVNYGDATHEDRIGITFTTDQTPPADYTRVARMSGPG